MPIGDNPYASGYINSYHYFTGTNTFSSLTIDNAAGFGTGRNWAYFNGTLELHQRGQCDHGNRRRHCRQRASSGTMTIGTINMSAGPGSYIPLGYAIRGNNVIQIGAGGTGTTGGSVANSARPSSSTARSRPRRRRRPERRDLLLAAISTGGQRHGRPQRPEQLRRHYGHEPVLSRNVDTDGPMPLVQLGVNNALPTTTDLSFGEANGNSGALDLHGFNQTVNIISTWNKSAAAITTAA